MPFDDLKIPLPRSLDKIAQQRSNDPTALAGKDWPCEVVEVTGQIVKVKFLVQSPFNVNQSTMPIDTGINDWVPVKIGTQGVAKSADVYLGGVSGLGGGTANLVRRSNLSMLVFHPVSNKAWKPPSVQGVADQNTRAVGGDKAVLYGKNGDAYTFVDDQGNAWLVGKNKKAFAHADSSGTMHILGTFDFKDANNNQITSSSSGIALNRNFLINQSGGLSGPVSILAYGGSNDGTGDNTAAFAACVAAATGPSPVVYFPAGTYRFLSGLVYDFAADVTSMTVMGDGSDVTVLHFPDAVGAALAFNLIGFGNSVHVKDMTFATGQVNLDIGVLINQTATTGLTIDAGFAWNTLSNLTFRSDEGYSEEGVVPNVTRCWNFAVYAVAVSNITFDSLNVYGLAKNNGVAGYPLGWADGTGRSGNGVSLTKGGYGTNIIPTVYNFVNCAFTWLDNGVIWAENIQGIAVSNCNFTGCFAGMSVPSGQGGGATLLQVLVSNSQFNNIFSILLLSQTRNVGIVNCLFLIPSSAACWAILTSDSTASLSAIGNSFLALTAGVGNGISVNVVGGADLWPAVISGNTFAQLGTGVQLGAGTAGATLQGNIYAGTTTDYVDSGAGNRIGVATP